MSTFFVGIATWILFSLVWKNRRLSNVGHFLMEKVPPWTWHIFFIKPEISQTVRKRREVQISTNPTDTTLEQNFPHIMPEIMDVLKYFSSRSLIYQPTSLETFSWWKVNLFFWKGVWWWDDVWEMWDLWRTAGHDALAQLWLDFMPWGWRTCPQAVRSSDHECCWWLAVVVGKSEITGRVQPVEGVKGSFFFPVLMFSNSTHFKKYMAAKFHVLMMKTCDMFNSVNQWKTVLWRPASLFSKGGVHV